MNEKVVSIIVPAYNVEPYIGRCLNSLLKQTYQNIEIIVVDDGATDKSGAIIEQYAKKDKRVFVIHKKNGGLSSARNAGLKKCTGEYVLFVDGDDYLDFFAIEQLLRLAKRHCADIVMFPYVREFENKSIKTRLFEDTRVIFFESDIKKRLLSYLIGPSDTQSIYNPLSINRLNTAWGKLYKRTVIDGIEFVDTKVIGAEDGLYNITVFLRMMEYKIFNEKLSANRNKLLPLTGVAVYTEDTWSHYEKGNEGSLLHTYQADYFYKRWNFYSKVKDLLIDTGNTDFIPNLKNRIVLELFGIMLNLVNSTDTLYVKAEYLKSALNKYPYKNCFEEFRFDRLSIVWRLYFEMIRRRHCMAVVTFTEFLLKFRR